MKFKNLLLKCLLIIFLLGCSKESSLVLPQPDKDNGGLFLPDGFGVLVVVDSVGPSRHLAVNNNGDIYLKLKITEGRLGNVAIRDTDNDGKADIVKRFGDYPNDGSFARFPSPHSSRKKAICFSNKPLMAAHAIDCESMASFAISSRRRVRAAETK